MGSLTTIVGNNGTGKSLLLEFVASLFQERISPRLLTIADDHELSVVAEFTNGHIGGKLIFERKFTRRQPSGEAHAVSWLNGSRYAGDVESAIGHRLINVEGEKLYHPSQESIMGLACRALTGKSVRARKDRLDILRLVLERHVKRLEGTLGSLAIDARGHIVLKRLGKTTFPFAETVSLGDRLIGALGVMCCVAAELSSATPTILLLDQPVGCWNNRAPRTSLPYSVA